MQMNRKTNSQVQHACKTIFGPAFNFNCDTLAYIQESGLKSAYREKAKLYHPDRAILSEFSEEELQRRFKEVTNAYNLLLDLINGSAGVKKDFTKAAKASYSPYNQKNTTQYRDSQKKTMNRDNKSDFFYSGAAPRRSLKFGEYLFYNKVISWNSLISAITWQYRKRPKIGQLCKQKNLLSETQIARILKNLKPEEKFGSAAVRHGYVKTHHIKSVLREQTALNVPLGRYFVENGLIGKDQLSKHLMGHQKHNRKFS